MAGLRDQVPGSAPDVSEFWIVIVEKEKTLGGDKWQEGKRRSTFQGHKSLSLN